MIFKPYNYQRIAGDFAIVTPNCALLLEMALGKTVITLTVIQKMLDSVTVLKPIIIAPKLVTEQTWIDEVNKWDHLRTLKISRIIGNEKQRLEAINASADIYAVSRDNIAWLVEHFRSKWPYDMIVLDESSSFKNRDSKRFKALRKVRGLAHRFIELTGTPAPNGLMDLWAQVFLLDGGVRLGNTIGGFRNRYFHQVRKGGEYAISYELKKGAKESIYEKISDICLSMRAKDWIDLPERIDVVQRIRLPNMVEYKQFERDKVLELDGAEITPVNVAGLYMKLLQFCNGAVYDDDHRWHLVSNMKLDALEENIEALNGENVIIVYQFQSDIDRIRARFPDVVMLSAKGSYEAWNRGEINKMLMHAAGGGHGLNLQGGGFNMIWFGVCWPLELFQQASARLPRPGQPRSVMNKMIICEGTVEELQLMRLSDKEFNQNDLMMALRRGLEN